MPSNSSPQHCDDPVRTFALEVVRKLRSAGHEALWAGGCVRDLLLQQTPKDYDVATSARPEQVQKIFRRTLEVGASFGVIFVLGRGGLEVQVATFRTDANYSDGRHPDAVTYSTAREDALRRDFTVNGMFYDPVAEELYDYVHGRRDIEDRVIRAIGNPRDRIAEDKLRMLRAVRFAARLEFRIDPETATAVREMADQLSVVSSERILAELTTMLQPPTRMAALEYLRDLKLLPVVFPELADTFAEPASWDRTLAVEAAWNKDVSIALAFAGLLACCPDDIAPGIAERILRRLRASNEDRERAVWIVRHRRGFNNSRNARLSHLKRLFAHDGCEELLDFHEALCRAGFFSLDDNAYCRQLRNQLTPEEVAPSPLLTGHDLIAAGLKPGPQFQQILDEIRDQQLDGTLTNRAEALSWLRNR